MAFAQLTYRESLRDTITCLKVLKSKLFHAGIRGKVARSTLADANEKRNWRIYADFARVLIQQARTLYADTDLGVDFDSTVYALDSSIIDLCLSVFPWARFTKHKAAVKLHTLLDLRGNIPEFVHISDGKMYDAAVFDILIPQAGAIYVIDRGDLHFKRLYQVHRQSAFFITRAKSTTKFTRRYSHPVDKTTGLRCDQTGVLSAPATHKCYPATLQRIAYRDLEKAQSFVFLTNNLDLPALSITKLYKARWEIELFFRWIKQHLRIKAFYGTTENAVKTQIWIAVSIYVLVAILKKRLHLDQSLYTILQILSVSLFEKTPISLVFSQANDTNEIPSGANQLELFNF